MTRTLKLATALLVAAMVSPATPALAGPVRIPEAGLPLERALAKAVEGEVVLRRFIQSTRGIYGLYYLDVIREFEARKAAQGGPKVATADTAVATSGRR